MAEQVRDSVRGRRKWVAAAGAGGAILAILILFVLPAFGAVGGLITPRSYTEGLVPIERDLGGVNNDCDAVHSAAAYSIRFENPSSPPPMPITVGGKPVTITSTVSSIGGEQFYTFSITGAVARDVVIKGGTNSAHYAYDNPTVPAQTANLPAGGQLDAWSASTPYYPARAKQAVTADRNLHATRSSTGAKKLYSVSHVSFCLDTSGSIGGVVFNDTNGNGSQDAGEPGISGRSVLLYAGTSDQNGEAAQTATTSASGGYSFSAQLGSDYRVCLVGASGLTQSAPSGPPNCTLPSSAGQRPVGYAVPNLGLQTPPMNFGEAHLLTLSGKVFADANDNGVDNGEAGIPGRTVRLYTGASTQAAEATTAQDGSYSFPNLSADNVTYKVCLAAAAGYAQTLPRSSTSGSVECTGTGPAERSYGYGLTPTDDTGGLSFGEIVSNCTLETGNPPRYIVKFTYQCKDTARFLVDYSDAEGNKIASVEPLDTTQPKVPVLEKIIWSLPADGHQFQLLYDDTTPYGDTTPTLPGDLAPKPMLDCTVEPRDAGAADPEFTLSSLYDQYSESGAVVRTGETSCLVASTISVEDGTYTAYVYSALDGWRSTP
jgi:hypothetical protein